MFKPHCVVVRGQSQERVQAVEVLELVQMLQEEQVQGEVTKVGVSECVEE